MKRYDQKYNIKESSLSRIWQHIQDYDTGIITAYRDARDCGKGDKYTKKEKQQRNKSLLAKLQNKRYDVTSLKGSYIENYKTKDAKEVGEHVFFVVDSKDKGDLKKDLKYWGEEFEQDSILYIPKGGENGFLIGTNHCPNGYPGYGVIKKLNNPIFGESGEFFTRVKGRPFVFYESKEIEHFILPEGFFGRLGCKVIADTFWGEL